MIAKLHNPETEVSVKISNIGVMPDVINLWNPEMVDGDYDYFRQLLDEGNYIKPESTALAGEYFFSIPRQEVDTFFIHEQREMDVSFINE